MSAATKKRRPTTLDEDELLQDDALPAKKSRSNDGDDTFEEEELDEDALLGLSDNEEPSEHYEDGSGYQLDEDGGYDVMAGEDDFAEEEVGETDEFDQDADGGYEEEEEYTEEGTEEYQEEDANIEQEEEEDVEQEEEQYNEGTSQEVSLEPAMDIFDDVLDIDITDDSLIKELEDDSRTSGPSTRRMSGTFVKPSEPPPKSSSTPKTTPKSYNSPKTTPVQSSPTGTPTRSGKSADDGTSLPRKVESGGASEAQDESVEDDDEDDDNEEKETRGRFTSERKEIVSLKSSRNRDIPDTLELSEQSKKELEEYERQEQEKRQQKRQRQQNWRGRRGGRGQRGGWFERGRGVNNMGRMPFGHEQYRPRPLFGPRGPHGPRGLLDHFHGPRPPFRQPAPLPIIPIVVQQPLITLTNADFTEDDMVESFEESHRPPPPAPHVHASQSEQPPPSSRGRSPTRPVIHVNPHFRGKRPQLAPTSQENSSAQIPQPAQGLSGQQSSHVAIHSQSHHPSNQLSHQQPPHSAPPQTHDVYREENSWKDQHHQPPSSQGQHWSQHHPPVSQHEHAAPASSLNHPHSALQNEPVYAQSTIKTHPPLLPIPSQESTYHAPHQQFEHHHHGRLQRDGQHHTPPDQKQHHHQTEWFEAERRPNEVHHDQHLPNQHHHPHHPPAHHQTRFPGPGQLNSPPTDHFRRSPPDHRSRFTSPPQHQNQRGQQGQKNDTPPNVRPVPSLVSGNAPQQPRRKQLVPPPQAIIDEASKQQQAQTPTPTEKQAMPEDNDPETKRLRLQIEEQKKLREEVVKRKEQRRQQLAAKRQIELKKRMTAQKQQQAAESGNQSGQQQQTQSPQQGQQLVMNNQQQQPAMNKQQQQQIMNNQQAGQRPQQQQGQRRPSLTKQPPHPGVQQVRGRGAKAVGQRGKPIQQRRNSAGQLVQSLQGTIQSGPVPQQPPPQQYNVPVGQPILAIGGGPSKPSGPGIQHVVGNRQYQQGGGQKNVPSGGRGHLQGHQQQNPHQQGNFQRGGMTTRRPGRGQSRGHLRGRGRGNVNQQQRQVIHQGQNIDIEDQQFQPQNQPHGLSGMQGPAQGQPYQQPQQHQQQFQQQHHQPQQRGRGHPGKGRGGVKQRLGRGGFQQSPKMGQQQQQQPPQRGGMQQKRGRGGGHFQGGGHPNAPQGMQRQHPGGGDAPMLNPQCGVSIEGLAETTHGDDVMKMMLSVGPVQALKMYPNHRKAIGFFFNPNNAAVFQQRFNGVVVNYAPLEVKLIWRPPP